MDISEAMAKSASLFKNILIEELLLARKRSSGALIGSIRSSVIESNGKWTLTISSLPYLKWVDQGRKPGKQPPVSAIIPWVRRENIQIGKDDKSTAFVIARSIGRKGIKPSNVIEKTKVKTIGKIKEAIAEAYLEEINKLFEW